MMQKILFIGGDARLDYAKQSFLRDGFLCESFVDDVSLKESVQNSDIIILGLPVSQDDTFLNAKNLKNPVLLSDFFRFAKGKVVFGGGFSDYVKAMADINDVIWGDYSKRDDFKIANAIPTAEGAIEYAMHESLKTLFDSSCAVLGYGIVAEALAKRLYALKSKVTVFARKKSAIEKAISDGMIALDFKNLPVIADRFDIIFNTVPATVIGREVLLNMKKDALVIDLASRPGGVDFDCALDVGTKVIWALSLPGKVAPESAGKVIKNTVSNMINELGL